MRKVLLLLCLSLLVTASPVLAGKSTYGLTWNVSLPTGETNDFVSGVHFRGFSLEWLNYQSRDTAFGINAGWNVFNESFHGTISGDNFAVTGSSWRYVNAVPIYASYHKYMGVDRRDKRAYLGLNGGMSYIETRTQVAIWELVEDNWHLAIAPEIGVQLPWNAFLGTLALRYNYAFSAGDSEAHQWLELRIGFGGN